MNEQSESARVPTRAPSKSTGTRLDTELAESGLNVGHAEMFRAQYS